MACDGLYPNVTCNESLTVKGDSNPATSIIMFLAGVVGNLLALFILGVHRKEHRSSPSVFICYARNVSLIGLGDESLCQLFGFAMSFFGLAPTLILCAMAVERCLAISHPYFYSVHIRQSFAKVTLVAVYLFSLAFCLLPFVGIGKFRQYCPGTWCFIDMDATGDAERVQAFSLTYSSLMALIILAVFACNGSVIASLCQMHRSHLIRRGSACSAGRKRKLSLALFGWGEEELDHLVLLALITVIFAVCSLPLTIAGFINAIHPFCGDNENLAAFRFYAFNPIVDPWVFIICRKSVLRHLRSLLSCRFGQGAGVKTPAHCSSAPLPLESHVIQYKPPEGTESSFYSGVPSSPTT
ncbi:prostacyclin receptor isoform X2 [Syngnathus acus]|uniref:prostacyclin receptor isoform X2 n=1 Tax=Syngnathus acus TaxID=161584 RepID=UPI0018862EF1|nr:prostacyclin receptor isoform X2 [Syngnathus acus]